MNRLVLNCSLKRPIAKHAHTLPSIMSTVPLRVSVMAWASMGRKVVMLDRLKVTVTAVRRMAPTLDATIVNFPVAS